MTRRAARTFYGGHAGYFTDPDGSAWQVAHNHGFVLAEDGSITIPDVSSRSLPRIWPVIRSCWAPHEA